MGIGMVLPMLGDAGECHPRPDGKCHLSLLSQSIFAALEEHCNAGKIRDEVSVTPHEPQKGPHVSDYFVCTQI